MDQLRKKIKRVVAGLFLACLGGAPWMSPALAQETKEDPLVKVNRGVYGFNGTFDGLLVKPVTRGYDTVMPGIAKRGVSNFFKNLDDINVVVNDLLQFKMKHALNDCGRLVINSTVGIGGVIDVASNLGLYKNDEDFGQTLGYWGIDPGAYIVIPFLGSSTVRDTVGLIPDFLLNPVFWINDVFTRNSVYAVETVDKRLYYMAAESMISGDEYIFVRDAYLQNRAYLVADGEVYDEFDDF